VSPCCSPPAREPGGARPANFSATYSDRAPSTDRAGGKTAAAFRRRRARPRQADNLVALQRQALCPRRTRGGRDQADDQGGCCPSLGHRQHDGLHGTSDLPAAVHPSRVGVRTKDLAQNRLVPRRLSASGARLAARRLGGARGGRIGHHGPFLRLDERKTRAHRTRAHAGEVRRL
jgi:hypothetical protein